MYDDEPAPWERFRDGIQTRYRLAAQYFWESEQRPSVWRQELEQKMARDHYLSALADDLEWHAQMLRDFREIHEILVRFGRPKLPPLTVANLEDGDIDVWHIVRFHSNGAVGIHAGPFDSYAEAQAALAENTKAAA